jgi:hypothetical protein
MKRAHLLRMPKPPKLLKPKLPKLGRAGRASGGTGGSASADTGADDSSIYRASTGSPQDQAGSADTASLAGQDNSDLTQDYARGGAVRAARRSSSNPAGDMGGSPGLAQMRKPYR